MQGCLRHEQVHLARSVSVGGGSGEASGESTPRAGTPDIFDEEKWRTQELRKAEKTEKKIRQDEEKKKEMEERKQIKAQADRIKREQRAKEKKQTLADSMQFYNADFLERGVPLRLVDCVVYTGFHLPNRSFSVDNQFYHPSKFS